MYTSKAQAGYMHAAEKRGDMPHRVVAEFDRKSRGRMKGAPEHAGDRKKKHTRSDYARAIARRRILGV